MSALPVGVQDYWVSFQINPEVEDLGKFRFRISEEPEAEVWACDVLMSDPNNPPVKKLRKPQVKGRMPIRGRLIQNHDNTREREFWLYGS